MLKPALIAAACLLAAPAFAEVHEVKMLSRGEAGTMVFEPNYVEIAPGDSVKFLATQPGHNAETIDGMIPEGAEGFKGKLNEEIEVTLDVPGAYGVRCAPHFPMGMVMVINVGGGEIPAEFLEGRIPAKAKERFETAIAQAGM